MSTCIYDKVAAVRIPAPAPKQGDLFTKLDDYFILAFEGGSSNCFDSNGLRTRQWFPEVAGTHADCMERATYMAVAFCGRNARFNGQNTTTPETFLHTCRKVLDTAPHYRGEPALTDVPFYLTQTSIVVPFPVPSDLLGVTAAIVKRRGRGVRCGYRGKKGLGWPFKVEDPEDIYRFIELLPSRWETLSDHLRIRGKLCGPRQARSEPGLRIFG